MAKKAVAGYRDKSSAKAFTKVIMAVKNENGNYSYKTEIVPTTGVKDYLKENQK